MNETPDDILERGRKEGRIDATLEQHGKAIARINGSIERFAKTNEQLTETVRQGLAELSDGLRRMQEQGRARDLATKVATETLAKETERLRREAEAQRVERASALEVPVRTWSLRSNKATVFYVFVALVAVLASIYFGTHSQSPAPAGPAAATLPALQSSAPRPRPLPT
jgi:sirohydrochlorin ferrochelatase